MGGGAARVRRNATGTGPPRTGLAEVQEALDLHELEADRFGSGRDGHEDIYAEVFAGRHLVGQRAELGLRSGALSGQPIATPVRLAMPTRFGGLKRAA